ncbi:MAG: hypothetical protein QM741_16035 [Rudaea sp.]|uniref:hypothetical protein n=1 Tax=Rudaea sp. TaxID=2136325 RepID=UPI0039E3D013
MKTTIDIADDLIDRAKLIQKRQAITLRALVEEGLRLVLDKHAKRVKPYKFEPVIVGAPCHEGMARTDVNALIAEAYAERDAKTFAVAEESAAYEVAKSRMTRRKRK